MIAAYSFIYSIHMNLFSVFFFSYFSFVLFYFWGSLDEFRVHFISSGIASFVSRSRYTCFSIPKSKSRQQKLKCVNRKLNDQMRSSSSCSIDQSSIIYGSTCIPIWGKITHTHTDMDTDTDTVITILSAVHDALCRKVKTKKNNVTNVRTLNTFYTQQKEKTKFAVAAAA